MFEVQFPALQTNLYLFCVVLFIFSAFGSGTVCSPRPHVTLSEELEMGTAPMSVSNLDVHVYGGSITQGYLQEDYRYSTVLTGLLPNVSVRNFGIGGTGVEPHINCQIREADIIVSEYCLNEADPARMRKFYTMAKKVSAHVVILDLWSWLEPNSECKITRGSIPEHDEHFSVLDLVSLASPLWSHQIPPFTARNMFVDVGTHYKEAEACYAAAAMSTKEDRRVIQKCTGEAANWMQHGTAEYHKFIAGALARHIRELGRTGIPLKRATSKISQEMKNLCITHWGRRNLIHPIACQSFINSAKYEASARFMAAAYCSVLNDTVLQQSGFTWSSLYGHSLKVTLHASKVSSIAILGCPSILTWGSLGNTCRYTHALIGYVAHGNKSESGTFEANGQVVDTFMPAHPGAPEAFRIQHFTPQLKLPVRIVVTKLYRDAHIEITGIILIDRIVAT